MSKLKQLKEISKKFASASTVIGLARIVRAETKFMKICWAVMTLVSLAFGLYLTSGTFKDYLGYDVFTQTKSVSSGSILLPSVTFCFKDPQDENLNVFFETAKFENSNGTLTDLIGDQFYDEYFWRWHNSKCIKFNHLRNKSDNKLFSASSSDDYFYFNIYLNITYKGVRVFLSDNYNNIIDWSQYVIFSDNVRENYNIALRKEVEIKLEEPYNPCQNISDITYRHVDCVVKCKNKNFVGRHNCTLRNLYSISDFSFCDFLISESSEFESECEKECPRECTTTKFDIFLSSSDSELSGNLVFNVWYLDLNFIEISQTPKMSGFSLLNEIGGALGLFAGITVLSLLEFFEYLIEIFLVFYK